MRAKDNKINSKYTFSLNEKKRNKNLLGSEKDFDDMNKGLFDDIYLQDKNISKAKSNLQKTKEWTIKHSVYSNKEIPDIWKNKLTYPQEMKNIICKDKQFSDYLGKMEQDSAAKSNIKKLNKFTLKRSSSQVPIEILNEFENKSSTGDNQNQNKSASNIFTFENIDYNKINEIKKNGSFIERSDTRSPPKSRHTKMPGSPKKVYSEKDKRDILENYRTFYIRKYDENKITKMNQMIDSNNHQSILMDQLNFPRLSRNPPPEMNFTEKSGVFRSTIYTNLLPSNLRNTSIASKENTESKMFNTVNSLNIYSKKVNPGWNSKKIQNNTQGDFLHNNYAEIHKEVKIENKDIKKVLEDIDNYGPHFSHCPMCRNKNLEFYKNLEPNVCLNLLNYIKKTKRIKLKLPKEI